MNIVDMREKSTEGHTEGLNFLFEKINKTVQ